MLSRLNAQVPLVEGSRRFRKFLLSSGCASKSSTPEFVREQFRCRAAIRTKSLGAANPNARDNCLLLLHYCLADIGSVDARGRVGYEKLADLPLVPLVDGSHGVFRLSSAVARSPNMTYVLCAKEETKLFAGTGASLINESALTSGTRTGRGVTCGGRRVLQALQSSSFQSILNVASMRDDLLPDIIEQTLPASWRGDISGGVKVEAVSLRQRQAGHPDVDWLRDLWAYLASTRPTAVRLLAALPVVPTGNHVVCRLSLRSAVIAGGRLGLEVRSILIKAGCRMLLPGMFAGGEKNLSGRRVGKWLPPPPPELYEFVHLGSRDGVLAALEMVRTNAGKSLKHLMASASAAERDALRDFLAREPATTMSSDQVNLCRDLPIIPVHDNVFAAAWALESGLVNPVNSFGTGNYAAASTNQLYLLLEARLKLDGFEGSEGGGARGYPSAGSASPQFIKLTKPSAACKGAAEVALLKRLGAKTVNRAKLFVDHVFPTVDKLPAGLRDAVMVEALLEAQRLPRQRTHFSKALSELKFVPAGNRVSLIFACGGQ